VRFIRGWGWRLIIVLLGVSAALCVRGLLARGHPSFAPFLTFYPVVLLVALADGAVAGVLVTLLSAAAVEIWEISPKGTWLVHDFSYLLGIVVFIAFGISLSMILELFHRNRERLAEIELRTAIGSERYKADEERRVGELIAAERQRLINVLETLPNMVSLLAPDHRLLFANSSFRQKFGKCEGQRCFEARAGRSEPCVDCQAFIPLKTGQPHHWEVNFPDGSVVDTYDYPFTDLDGSSVILEVCQDITERRNTEKELRERNAEAALRESEKVVQQREQLQALAERLRKAREEERTRVSRDLHDQIGQILTAIKMDLTWITKRSTAPEVQERLKGSVELINEGVRSVRTICSGLRPRILDDLGLCAAIEWQASEFSSRTGIACNVSVPSVEMEIDADRTTAFFRIFQECLTNVSRHAEASRVDVSLVQIDGDLVMEVSDNGNGFFESQISESLGILGMRERARAFSGDIQVYSSPGAGASVCVRVPIKTKQDIGSQLCPS
jgi:signal transduction histidine kinase